MAKAHSAIVAGEYKRLGWTLVQEFCDEPGKQPNEYYFEWRHDGPPCHIDFERFEKTRGKNTTTIRSMACLFGAVIGPFIVYTVYRLVLPPGVPRWWDSERDLGPLLLAVVIGASCLLGLPIPMWLRVLLFVFYFPIFVVLIVTFSCFWGCFVMGDAL